MRLRPAGRDGVLVEVAGTAEARRLYAEIRRRSPDGLVDVVPAARTVLLVGPRAAAVAAGIRDWAPSPAEDAADVPTVEIPVVYDGADLPSVAARIGIPVQEVVRLHTSSAFVAAFCGFVPGFAYLEGLPPALRVPRLDSPRTSVPAGSVAIAGEWCGVYPRATPGGWNLLGRTSAAIFDAARDPPALIAPGTRVRFVEAAA